MAWLRRIAGLLSLKGRLSRWVDSRAGPASGYVAAVLIVAAALELRMLLTPWITGAQFITFFPAVIVSTLLFGTAVGLATVVLAAVASAYFLSTAGLSTQEAYSLAAFVAVALMDVAIISALLAANAALRTSLGRIEHLNAGLARSEAKFRNLLETAPDAMVVVDGDGRIALVNAEAETMFGYSRAELIGQSVDLIMPDRFRGAHESRIRAFAASSQVRRMGYGRELFGLRRNGSEFPIETNLSLLNGGEHLVSSAIRDVTQRKAAEERQALLIRELNHRVKNTLASVQAIVSQTLTAAKNPTAFSHALTARLAALSKSHDVLTRNDWAGALVRDLVAEQLGPYGARKVRRFRMTGPAVRLSPNRAVTLGMMLGELATNAAKYGALSVEGGKVSVSWKRVDEDGETRLRLAWREIGGPAVRQPRARGFGARLIERGAATGLHGSARLAFRPDGLVCQIDFPLQADET